MRPRCRCRVELASGPTPADEGGSLNEWNLARRTGFDLESLLFSFAIGGIVFAMYDALAGTAPASSMRAQRSDPRHRYHLAAVLAAPANFLVLLAITRLNPIYAATCGPVGGFLRTLCCRPDLWPRCWSVGACF